MRVPSPPTSSPDIRAFLHERLDALLDDCHKVGDNAAYGRYIHDLDDFLYIEGRKFMQEVLEQKLQEHIRNDEGNAEWCEAKVGTFVKRELGESAVPEYYASRNLPEPTVVSAFAAEGSGEQNCDTRRSTLLRPVEARME